MQAVQLGATAEMSLRVADATGAAADPDTVACTATRPDGLPVACSVTKLATGSYLAQAVAAMAGRWLWTWTGTGANASGLPWSEPLDVWPLDPRMIVPLGEARAALNLPASVVVHDDELRLHCLAATPVIEDIVGPVLAASRTVTMSGAGRAGLVLPDIATAVSSVAVSGTTLDESTYWLDAGIVWRRSGVWPIGMGNVVVSYTVGASAVAANVLLAGRELVAHLYQTSQQGKRPAFGGAAADGAFTPSGFAVPRRVLELLAPSRRGRALGMA